VYRKKRGMVNLNTGVMFFRIHLHALLGVGSFTKVSAIAESLRNTGVDPYEIFYVLSN